MLREDRQGPSSTRKSAVRKRRHLLFGATETYLDRIDPAKAIALHGSFEKLLETRSLPFDFGDGAEVLFSDNRVGSPETRKSGLPTVEVPSRAVDRYLRKNFKERLTHRATSLLRERQPELSAATPVGATARAGVLALVGVVLLLAVLSPSMLCLVVLAAAATFCLASMALKAVLTLAAFPATSAPARIAANDLPRVTLLLPVFRERRTLASLVRSLRDLDYPTDLLEIKFLTEQMDTSTTAKLRELDLPEHFEILQIPDSEPRTKPKAMNFALPFVRGEIVGIYDAEDNPEPDQIRKAVAALRQSSPETVCVQARLNHYNASEGWFPCWASLEYGLWFDFLLNGLSRLGLPVPLGGTSLFIETSALRALDGWDPANVTEDADLGVRLARRGWRAAVIDSTTWEEAPDEAADWIKQRTRWIKGFMVTWMVHNRNPVMLFRELGFIKAIAINIMLLDGFLAFLLQPFFWALVLSQLAWGGAEWLPANSALLLGAITVPFVVGHLFIAFATFVSAKRRFGVRRALLAPSLWIYWQLATISAYRALGQLFTDHTGWEKTRHGGSEAARRRRVAARGKSACVLRTGLSEGADDRDKNASEDRYGQPWLPESAGRLRADPDAP